MAPVLSDITQGRRLARLEAGGVTLHEIEYAGECEMPAHSHRTANISLLLAGQFEEQVDGTSEFCSPLSVVLKPAGTVHATRCCGRATRSLILEIAPDLEDRLRRRTGLFDRCVWIHDAGPVAACVLGLWRLLRAGDRPTEPLIDRWFAHLAAAAPPARAARRPIGPHIRTALDLLQLRPAASSTSSLARELDLHPVYLARLFRQRLGCSPTRFRIRRQVSAAVDRLVHTRDPAARIAVATGFADQSHLCRRLKQETGLTPSVLRRLATAP